LHFQAGNATPVTLATITRWRWSSHAADAGKAGVDQRASEPRAQQDKKAAKQSHTP